MMKRVQRIVAPTVTFCILQSFFFVTDCTGSESGHLLRRGLASPSDELLLSHGVVEGDPSWRVLAGQIPPAECSAHPKCTGLSGNCCPSANGFFQTCCSNVIQVPTPPNDPDDEDNDFSEEGGEAGIATIPPEEQDEEDDPEIPPPDNEDPETPPAGGDFDPSCSAHPRCARIGLEGTCCPTGTSADMYCCEGNVRPRECEANAFCDALDLGLPECCPNRYGFMWACCFKNIEITESASCSAHPKCASLGVTGQCCPTKNSVYLDCCS